MSFDNTSQYQALEPCRAVFSRDGERVDGGGCTCPGCEPDSNAFLDPSAINPSRRISVTSNSGNSAPANALGSQDSSENNANRSSNAVGGTGGDPSLSGAIGFLQQLNDGPPDSGANTAGANNDGGNSSNATPSGDDTNVGGSNNATVVQDEYEDEEDEAYESEGSVGLPSSRIFQGFLNHMISRSISRPRENLSRKITPDDDDEEDSDDEYEDTDNARCAACFRIDNQNHKWRRLVTLPCCGTNGREANSSTRFCAACILKVAVTRAHSSNTSEYRLYDDEPDEYPVRKFYQKSLQTDNRRFCECPRCRDILLVKIKGVKPAVDDSDDDSSECECDCSDCEAERRERRAERNDCKTAKSISLNVPSFKAKCWYIGRKRGVAKLLWKVAHLHHNFMPFEALGGDDEKATILRLAGWGIIEKVPGKRNTSLYRMNKQDQTKLIKFFRPLKNPPEKDLKSEAQLIHEFIVCLGYAAWRHLRDEYRLDRSLRMFNRFSFLALHMNGYLPPLPLSWLQELVVTALVVFSVALAAQFVCIIVVYALAFFSVGLSVCYALRRSNNIKSSWWQYVSLILVSYFSYRLKIFFYENPYLSWSVMVSPKAMIPVKNMLWG